MSTLNKFHENPSNGLVADTRSKTDGVSTWVEKQELSCRCFRCFRDVDGRSGARPGGQQLRVRSGRQGVSWQLVRQQVLSHKWSPAITGGCKSAGTWRSVVQSGTASLRMWSNYWRNDTKSSAEHTWILSYTVVRTANITSETKLSERGGYCRSLEMTNTCNNIQVPWSAIN